jgi:hypothetical protein
MSVVISDHFFKVVLVAFDSKRSGFVFAKV